MNKLKELNSYLNKFRYGILIGDKVITKNIDYKKYKTIDIPTMDKYRVGTCWDFSNYEYHWLKDHNYKCKVFFMCIDNNDECPSHSFVLVYLNNKVYWLESSWFIYQGIHEYDNEEDALFDVINKHNNHFNKNNKYKMYYRQYTPNKDLVGISPTKYMDIMLKDVKEYEIRNTIIFDLGSVLVKNTTKESVKKTNIPEEYIEYMAYKYYSNAHGITETMSIMELLKYYKSKLEPEYRKYASDALYLFASAKKPFDYTIPLLKELKSKGYKIYYLSNWNKASFTLCKKNGIFDFLKEFDGGIISYQVNKIKPNKDIYELLLKKYSLNPDFCIFYDDKQKNVDTANELGIKGVKFTEDTVKEIKKLPKIK